MQIRQSRNRFEKGLTTFDLATFEKLGPCRGDVTEDNLSHTIGAQVKISAALDAGVSVEILQENDVMLAEFSDLISLPVVIKQDIVPTRTCERNHVTSAAVHHNIAARTCPDPIIARPAADHVVAVIPIERVIARRTVNRVIARTATDAGTTCAAVQMIITAITENRVIAELGHHKIGSIVAADHLVFGVAESVRLTSVPIVRDRLVARHANADIAFVVLRFAEFNGVIDSVHIILAPVRPIKLDQERHCLHFATHAVRKGQLTNGVLLPTDLDHAILFDKFNYMPGGESNFHLIGVLVGLKIRPGPAQSGRRFFVEKRSICCADRVDLHAPNLERHV